MSQTAEVVVVGGGVNGASIAYALAAKGVKVTLVEKGALAGGASGRSSALVRMHYTNEWDARLAWASFPVFRHWAELMGGPPVFTHTGFVNVVAPAYAEHLRQNVQMLRRIGVNTTAITPAELRELQPFAHVDDVGAAAYEPESGYANPAETVEGFRRRAVELGARVLPWTAVTRIVRRESRVTGVATPAGRIDAGHGAQLLTHRIPAMERATLSRGYRAFDGYSADRHAILGAVHGIDGLYLATAFSGSGYKIAPAVGTCMAELITDGRAKTVDIEAFGLRRFAEGRTVEGPYPYAVRPDYVDPAAT